MTMNSLELFAGSRSFSKVAAGLGFDCFTSDYRDFPGIDYVTDVLAFDVSRVPFVPDVIWASPPCTFFSVASIGRHWNADHTPKTAQAVLGVQIVQRTIAIIQHFQALNPNMLWFVENPCGKLRKLPVLREYLRHTITYCQYGDTRMKPTDVWTNSLAWRPRPRCFNGQSCHVAAPRGSRTGTQGITGAFDRSRVPDALCAEILESTKGLA
jgi:hypothetical protein